MGFRPAVYRLATGLGLAGWVSNTTAGVVVELEGTTETLETFRVRLAAETPPRAVIQSLETSWLEAVGHRGFEIRESDGAGDRTAIILPDMAPCPDCLAELFDPADRRFRYPFLNCTNCGPRFSLIESLPYDRPNTSMNRFTMCARCETEYRDSRDRRFHAQPNACPECGPRLRLWNASGDALAEDDEALAGAAETLRRGGIVALKGVGGFQLLVDARNVEAVEELRRRKQRRRKPLAVMMPSLDQCREVAKISEAEARLMQSPETPIVLVRKRAGDSSGLAESIALGAGDFGLMLPSSPLHHLLLHDLGFPVVATSGNLSSEPICIDEHEALVRLAGIADAFLVHERPIVRHVDDSVARVVAGREQVLRRARGYAPLPILVGKDLPIVLAAGPHLKNTVALGVGRQVFVSQHIGDLETPVAHEALLRVMWDFQRLYGVIPDRLGCDHHPEYLSTREAIRMGEATGREVVPVQHHHAHLAACLAENGLEPPVLGIIWDGTGLGTDGTIWGGEFLLADGSSFKRVAHLRPFRLPGGEQAIREPRRCALGMFHEMSGDGLFEFPERPPLCHFAEVEIRVLRQALRRKLQAPITSSMGRLFDAVASLLDLHQRVEFEGQAAMELEAVAAAVVEEEDESYPFELLGEAPVVVDWEPLLLGLLRDRRQGVEPGRIAARFHRSLVEIGVAVARRVGIERVALSGGCFQSRLLTEGLVRRLREEGFRPFWHQRIPPNDGGVSLGQVMAAAMSGSKPPPEANGGALRNLVQPRESP